MDLAAALHSPLWFAAAAAAFGLIAGSFLNVVIHRLPAMLEHQWRHQCHELLGTPGQTPAAPANLVTPRSRCPHCGHAIGMLENIPLLSFLWLRGRCSACGRPISWRYPAVEALAAVLAFVTAWRFGFGAPALLALLLTWALLAATFIDLERQLLPDALTLPLLWLGLLVNLNGTFAPLPAAVAGAVAGYLALWVLFHLYRLLTGKEGMGHGDFKLLALFGAWLGWPALPLVILLASFSGAVVGLALIAAGRHDRRQPIPFGPFLCAAGWIALLWGDALTDWYLQFARLG
jgi:leader peptidase (prepilin peptidase)/N-methyltransferase